MKCCLRIHTYKQQLIALDELAESITFRTASDEAGAVAWRSVPVQGIEAALL